MNEWWKEEFASIDAAFMKGIMSIEEYNEMYLNYCEEKREEEEDINDMAI